MECSPDASIEGQGHLIEVVRDGNTVREERRLLLGAGLVYHPGGLATDGKHIYVPVSEYRPDSSCRIYRVDAETLEVLGEPVIFPDHIGALSVDAKRKRVFGMSWAAMPSP